MCRSRRELSNAYLLAKIGVDTAENEPCKVCPLSVYRSPRLSSVDSLPLGAHRSAAGRSEREETKPQQQQLSMPFGRVSCEDRAGSANERVNIRFRLLKHQVVRVSGATV